MNRILSYQEHLMESLGNRLLDQILDGIKPTSDIMRDKIIEATEKSIGRPLSKNDKEYIEESLKYDLIRSIEKYTKPTDRLISMDVKTGIKGNIEISSVIERDGKQYTLFTEAIYAGGYNIQVLHYRYRTSTNLPSTGESSMSGQIKERMKRLSKVQKLEKDIESFSKRAEGYEKSIAINSKLSDKEIWNQIQSAEDSYKWPSWDEIVKRGADVNYNKSEDFYKSEMEKSKINSIDRWKRLKVQSPERSLQSIKKEIHKMEQKLRSL